MGVRAVVGGPQGPTGAVGPTGPIPIGTNDILFSLSGANLQLTTDQAFSKNGSFTTYVITAVIARRASGAVVTSCLGGIYTAATKGGTPLVAATQSWANLTGANKIVEATLAAVNATDAQTATPILSLTTGSTGACTADFTIYGYALD